MPDFTKTASNNRIMRWAEEIRNCNSRPKGQTVADWCRENGISLKTYYYHHKKVGQAILDRAEEAGCTFMELPASASNNNSLPIKMESGCGIHTAAASVPEQVSLPAAAAIIRTGNMTVSVSPDAPAGFLQKLIGALSHV